MTTDEKDEAARLRRTIKEIEEEGSEVFDFMQWLFDSEEFAVVDIANGTETPMECVELDLVQKKYLEYLIELLAAIEDAD